MAINQKITTLADFTGWVQNALSAKSEPPQEKQAFFYRGHADSEYQLQPSVYRKNTQQESYRAVEYQLYQDMLHRNPMAFAEDKTFFERLVRMQHHGLPTRLLDITQSPLVALFFACESCPEKDGEVMFFCPPQSAVSYQSALPPAALAGVEKSLILSRLGFGIAERLRLYFENESKRDLIGGDEEFKEAYHGVLANGISSMTIVTLQPFDLLVINKILTDMEKAIDGFKETWGEKLQIRVQESQTPECKIMALESNVTLLNFCNRFGDFVKNTIADYCKQINIPYDGNWDRFDKFLPQFTHFYFVYPPLNNERIIRQQGAFLVFSPIASDYWTVNHFHEPIRITIKAEAKKTLLKELAHMGITRSYLFPELEEQAKDIKLRYLPTAEL